jgi:hypothetical protein
MEKALTQNAADGEQVRTARKKEKFSRESELKDLRELLALPAGRRFLWRLLGECKTFESIFSQSSMIYYSSGKQDVGHFLLAEISEAQPEALLSLMQDAATEDKKNA